MSRIAELEAQKSEIEVELARLRTAIDFKTGELNMVNGRIAERRMAQNEKRKEGLETWLNGRLDPCILEGL